MTGPDAAASIASDDAPESASVARKPPAQAWRWWAWYSLTDPLRNLWTRVTYCRKHGHDHYYTDRPTYCRNCGDEGGEQRG